LEVDPETGELLEIKNLPKKYSEISGIPEELLTYKKINTFKR
jgi:hypothetical protein